MAHPWHARHDSRSPPPPLQIAQRVTTPTAWVSALAAAQHVPATHLLIRRFGYVGAAYASTWSQLLALVLAAAYVRAIGLHPRVWGTPNGLQFQASRAPKQAAGRVGKETAAYGGPQGRPPARPPARPRCRGDYSWRIASRTIRRHACGGSAPLGRRPGR